MSTGHSSRPAARVEGLASHCVYQIATGKWAPGVRLPSVRAAESRWGVDRRVVLAAYRRLDALGLVKRRDRSGFYVAEGPELGRLARHRHELERLHARFEEELVRETGLSPLGAFRWLAELAELREHERPGCAFVECTSTQASGHADEIFSHLGVPCLPVTISELTPGLRRLPDHVRTLLVSAFHVGEVRLLAQGRCEVASVPIEVAGDLAGGLPAQVERGVLLELDEVDAGNILEDVQRLGLPLELEARSAPDVEPELVDILEAETAHEVVVLLSPRVWGSVDRRWREHPRVRQVVFRVREQAWPAIADAIGLPLGVLGGLAPSATPARRHAPARS